MTSRFRGRPGGRFGRKSISPLESVVNLIDVMLIFACGLMVSIIMLWNLDTTGDGESDQGGYQDVGVVYTDTESGKTYVVMNDDASQGASGQGSAEGSE